MRKPLQRFLRRLSTKQKPFNGTHEQAVLTLGYADFLEAAE